MAPKPKPPARRKTQKRKQATPRQQVIAQRRKPDYAHLAHEICAITDPFCPAAVGAKWPGIASARTLPYPFHGRLSISTNAAGSGSCLFLPFYREQRCQATTVAGGIADYTTVPGAVSGAALLSASLYRIVSWGIKIRNVTSPMLSSGIVRVRIYSPVFASSNSIAIASYTCEDFIDVPLQNCKELCVIGPRSGDRSELFNVIEPSAAGLITLTNTGWCYIQVAVEGAPATASPLDVEVFYNYELQFGDDDPLAMIATPASVASTMLTKASSYVSKQVGNFAQAGAKQLEGAVKQKAATFLGNALGSAFGPMGAIAGGAMGHAMITVD